jgi:hypothetical protein
VLLEEVKGGFTLLVADSYWLHLDVLQAAGRNVRAEFLEHLRIGLDCQNDAVRPHLVASVQRELSFVGTDINECVTRLQVHRDLQQLLDLLFLETQCTPHQARCLAWDVAQAHWLTSICGSEQV